MRTSRHMRHRPRTSRPALLPAPPRAPHENSRSQQRPTELAPPPWTRINSCAKAPRMRLLSLARAAPVSIGNRRRMCSLEHWDFRPRPLGRLGSSRLPAVHRPPIDPVICRGPYLVAPVGRVVLGRDSRLDAVSGSPARTWLPSHAGCPTTGAPAVRPARSSRTRASPPQPSSRPRRIETELSHDVLNPARVPL